MSRKTPATYSPRIQALRSEIIKVIPKVPNSREAASYLEGTHTTNLILIYLTWRMRIIPAKPRTVRVWSAGIDPFGFLSVRPSLQPLLSKVESGEDLITHLSSLVKRNGFVLRSKRSANRRDDKDMVLTKMGLHHFHVGAVTPENPKGRGGKLVFAEVTETEFTIVAVSDHDVFDIGSSEWRRLFAVSDSYIQKQMTPETCYMSHPTMSSGHSLILTLFSNRCEAELRRLDASIDDPDFIEQLYNGPRIERNGEPVERPKRPSFRWYFNDINFGILESKTRVFFIIVPLNR